MVEKEELKLKGNQALRKPSVKEVIDKRKLENEMTGSSGKIPNKKDLKRPCPVEYDIPIDRGWAWVVLIGSFGISMFVIGGIKSFGVLLVEFARVFDLPRSQMSGIQSLAGFFFLSLSPFSNALASKYSFRTVIVVGGFLTGSGLVLTSFVKSIYVMYITYGVITGQKSPCVMLYSIQLVSGFLIGCGSINIIMSTDATGWGFGLCFSPCVVVVPHHFQKFRALANGIVMAGAATGSIVIPYLIRSLIDGFSLQGCMLVLGGVMYNIIVCAALLRPFNKYPKIASEEKKTSTSDFEMNLLKKEKTVNGGVQDFEMIVSVKNKMDNEELDVTCCKKTDIESVNQVDESQIPLVTDRESQTVHQSISPKSYLGSLSSELCASLSALSTISTQNIPAEFDTKQDQIQERESQTSSSSGCALYNFIRSVLFTHMHWSLFKNIRFLLYNAYIFFAGYAYHTIFNVLPPYAKERGITDQQGALLIAIFGVADVVGRLFFGWMFDKCLNRRNILFILCNLLNCTGLFFIPQFGSFLTISIWISCFGIFTGGYNGTFVTVLSDRVGVEMISSAWGFVCFSVSIAMLINPVASGMILDLTGSWSYAFRLAGCLSLTGTLFQVADLIRLKVLGTSHKRTCENV